MDELLELVGELVDALERRDAAEPDLGWDADRDVRRFERQLVAEYRTVRVRELATAPEGPGMPVTHPAMLVASH